MPRFMLSCVVITLLSMLATAAQAADAPPLSGVRRVVFLGDSITYSGQYIEVVEAYLRLRDPAFDAELLDLGLPSETVSGLSEPGHAGGKFPRPDLHERLQRVLDKTKPDLVVACYGMNCGMYYPFSEERFAQYRQGIEFLRERAAAAGARVLHLTPPVFDPVPIQARTLPAGLTEYRQPYTGYNEVLDRYAEWLVNQRTQGWDVVDIHGPMNRYLAEHRKQDPKFRLANDGVHIDATGHWLIAQQLLLHWGAAGIRDRRRGQRRSTSGRLSAWPGNFETRRPTPACIEGRLAFGHRAPAPRHQARPALGRSPAPGC